MLSLCIITFDENNSITFFQLYEYYLLKQWKLENQKQKNSYYKSGNQQYFSSVHQNISNSKQLKWMLQRVHFIYKNTYIGHMQK